jgi:hypothetical protein
MDSENIFYYILTDHVTHFELLNKLKAQNVNVLSIPDSQNCQLHEDI